MGADLCSILGDDERVGAGGVVPSWPSRNWGAGLEHFGNVMCILGNIRGR